MTCETCGEKPKKCGNCNKDFPRAVIEINNPETLVLLRKVVIPTSMGTEEQVPPAIGKYHNVILYYEANKHVYLYSSDGIPTMIESEVPQDLIDRVADLEDYVEDLQEEFDEFKNSPDVVDIVPTYAALQVYDTSKLGDNDIIRVLQDEQHDGQSSYYRWSKTASTWTFIGTVGDYYTKTQTDTLLAGKQDVLVAGQNIQIEDSTISATDTTYSPFVGTDGTAAGAAGLVPAPAATDAGKVLDASGSWVTGGPNVVQSTGTSTADVMSQNATTSMVFADPETRNRIVIGKNAFSDNSSIYYPIAIGERATAGTVNTPSRDGIAIGKNARSLGFDAIAVGVNTNIPVSNYSVAIGANAVANASGGGAVAIGGGDGANAAKAAGDYSVAIGYKAQMLTTSSQDGQIALGSFSYPTETGQMDISLNGATAAQRTTYGYNGSEYRLLTGLYDPQSAHDAATKGYVDTQISAIGAGTRRASTTGWNTSAPLDYVLARNTQTDAQGAMFLAGKNLSDLPYYVGIGIDADETPDILGPRPYLLTQQVSDDGQGTVSGTPGAQRIALYGELQRAVINGGTTAPTTATVGAVGTQYTYVDTSGTPTAHLCVCVAVDTSVTPNTYTWQTLI